MGDKRNMSKMIKTLGIFLVVCFLMSVTAAAASADLCSKGSSNTMNKDGKGLIIGKAILQKKLSIGNKVVYIRNLIIAKNIVVINSIRTHPLLRAVALKKMKTAGKEHPLLRAVALKEMKTK
jgi:hypothetical protein